MEFGILLNENGTIQEFTRNVGTDEVKQTSSYYSMNNIKDISKKITKSLKGVEKSGRDIVVPDKTILNIMDSVYQSYRPTTGDIYGRLHASKDFNIKQDHIEIMKQEVIQIIVDDVKNNLETEYNNNKLNIWDTVLGDFNEKGLRGHAPIKVNNKNKNRGYVSFMNY